MRKQQVVLNKMDYDCGQQSDKLRLAKKRKNDEFYTPYNVVSNELFHYGNKLTGKNVICPCDWDIFEDEDVFSMTVEFNEVPEVDMSSYRRYKINKVKCLTYKLWEDNDYKEITVSGEEAKQLINERVTCNFLKTMISLGERYGIKSVTASGYDVDTGRGYDCFNIDYSDYDFCTTNPPFSTIPKFIDLMINESEKRKNTNKPFDFVILTPFINRANPSVGLNLMLEKCYLGYGRQLGISFNIPNSDDVKNVCVDWITTFSDAQDEIDKSRMHTTVKFDTYEGDWKECEGITMKDGTHPILINNYTIIPDDYYGWMKCSVGVLDKLSNEEFEWYGTGFKGYFNTTNPSANPFNHKATDVMVKDTATGKGFHGVVIRRRNNG